MDDGVVSETSSENQEFSWENFQYTSYEERRNAGRSVEPISGWFPPSTVNGRLSSKQLHTLYEKREEPANSILKTSAIDDCLRGLISRSAIEHDEKTRELIRDFSNSIRSTVNFALDVSQNETISEDAQATVQDYNREAITLYNHARAKSEISRRLEIAGREKWPEHLKAKCKKVGSDSRFELFGRELAKEIKEYYEEVARQRAEDERVKRFAEAVKIERISTTKQDGGNGQYRASGSESRFPTFKRGSGPKGKRGFSTRANQEPRQ